MEFKKIMDGCDGGKGRWAGSSRVMGGEVARVGERAIGGIAKVDNGPSALAATVCAQSGIAPAPRFRRENNIAFLYCRRLFFDLKHL